MKKIAIIGCGFSGTMTAVHLIKNAVHPFELILIGENQYFNTGIAYNPYSKKQLLNVITSRMSAFQDNPDDFTQWVAKLDEYSGIDKAILANTYLPRHIYGQYLREIWKEAVQLSVDRGIRIVINDALVIDITVDIHEVTLELNNGQFVIAHHCVIASGNSFPANPKIENTNFFNSKSYFQNPWIERSVVNHNPKAPILILGNGLTMVDTVLGLLENGFRDRIYTLSPHGFTGLPHRHSGIVYSAIIEELQGKQSLHELVIIVNKHIKLIRKLGFTAEPIIDAMRPLTQQLWQNLTQREKQLFMFRLRHLWNIARHRLPIQIHDRIRQLTETGKLIQYAGKLINITETETFLKVLFFDCKEKTEKEIMVSTVINCTGPETDLMKPEKSLIKNCLQKGIALQDELKLGIVIDPVTYEVKNGNGVPQRNLHAIGSLLIGVLWESTAVRELKVQSENLALQLLHKLEVNLSD